MRSPSSNVEGAMGINRCGEVLRPVFRAVNGARIVVRLSVVAIAIGFQIIRSSLNPGVRWASGRSRLWSSCSVVPPPKSGSHAPPCYPPSQTLDITRCYPSPPQPGRLARLPHARTRARELSKGRIRAGRNRDARCRPTVRKKAGNGTVGQASPRLSAAFKPGSARRQAPKTGQSLPDRPPAKRVIC